MRKTLRSEVLGFAKCWDVKRGSHAWREHSGLVITKYARGTHTSMPEPHDILAGFNAHAAVIA